MGYDRGDSFPSDFLNQMEFHLVQNRKENCPRDHTPFNLKGNGMLVFSVCAVVRVRGIMVETFYIADKNTKFGRDVRFLLLINKKNWPT